MKRKFDAISDLQREDDDINDDIDDETFARHELARFETKVAEILRLKPQDQVLDKFKEKGLYQFLEYCPHITKNECEKKEENLCHRIHWKPVPLFSNIVDTSKGDCILNNNCNDKENCSCIHYMLDDDNAFQLALMQNRTSEENSKLPQMNVDTRSPSQWIREDVNRLKLTVLGKFNVIMINTPFETASTSTIDQIPKLDIKSLCDEGLLFVWAPSHKLEVVRDWISHWGYNITDDIVWVKTTPLQRILRPTSIKTSTHFAHAKEHCLVAFKGTSDVRNLPLNRQIDADVIVSEVRPQGQKPDEIYGIIERLSSGGRKLELFGTSLKDGWITVSNNVPDTHIVDREVQKNYERYVEEKRR
jgi:mRNA (2'-O-methyladenosine-N6-)-methyltransferase